MLNVEETVKALLLRMLDITEEEITPAARFADDLEATSIDMIEIVSILQNTFDVDIKESDVADLLTVQDAITLFEAAIAQRERNIL